MSRGVLRTMERTRRPFLGTSTAVAIAVMLLSTTVAPGRAHAQDQKLLLGTTAGLAAGAWWSLSVIAAQARSGNALFTHSDLLSTAVPVIGLGLVAGVTTGIVDGDRLLPAVGWGLVGWTTGFGLGYVVGDAIWEDEAGKWAGAVIGAGAGLAVGALLGGSLTTGVADETGPVQQRGLLSFQHSIRIGR